MLELEHIEHLIESVSAKSKEHICAIYSAQHGVFRSRKEDIKEAVLWLIEHRKCNLEKEIAKLENRKKATVLYVAEKIADMQCQLQRDQILWSGGVSMALKTLNIDTGVVVF